VSNVLAVFSNLAARTLISATSLAALLIFSNGCSEKKDVSPPASTTIPTESSSPAAEVSTPDSSGAGPVGPDVGKGTASPLSEPALPAPVPEFQGLEPAESPN
jgi:hypothetical protein